MPASPHAALVQPFVRAVSFPPRKGVQSAAQTTPPVWSPPMLHENRALNAPNNQPKSDPHALWPVIHTRRSHRSGVCLGSFLETPPVLRVICWFAIQKAHRSWAGYKPKDILAGSSLLHPDPNIGSGFHQLAGNCPPANLPGSPDTQGSTIRRLVRPSIPLFSGSDLHQTVAGISSPAGRAADDNRIC